jgi:hypothetical protein
LQDRLNDSFVVLGKTLHKHIGIQMVANGSKKEWHVKTKIDMKIDRSIDLSTFFIKALIQGFLEWLDARKDFQIKSSVKNNKGKISCEYSIQVLNVD